MPIINFSGLASGIDANALIAATSEAQRTGRIRPLETKVTDFEDTNEKITELKTLLGDFKTKVRTFSTLEDGGIVKAATSSDESVLTATASSAAVNGRYSLTVTQLARNAVGSFNDRFATETTVINSSINNGDAAAQRTVTVTVGTGTEQEVTAVVLTNTTTWADFVTQFNNASTKATASMVNVGTTASPSYAVVITTDNEGISKGNLAISVGTSITGTPPGAMTAVPITQALNAQFSISGITGTITRDTNKVSGVLPGLTIDLLKTGSATVTVGDDVPATTTRVQELVDQYNEIVKFINDNNRIERVEEGANVTNIFGALSRTTVDNNALSALRNLFATTTATGGSLVRIFADLGITTQRDGTLALKTEDLEEAISNESSSVNSVLTNFADTAALTGGTIDQFIQFNGLFDLTTRGNDSQVSNLNSQIARIEQSILQREALERSRFARLEGLIGRLNNQQSALNSALAGLNAR